MAGVIPEVDPDEGEPAWVIAHCFPLQGEWTEEDYFEYAGRRGYELCDGRLEMLKPFTVLHQAIVGFLLIRLIEFIEPRKLGKALFCGLRIRTGPCKFREPDVVFMRAENAGLRSNRNWEGADLVMEVVSENDSIRDWDVKMIEYAEAGIPEYWIADSRKNSISVFVFESGKYRVHGEFKLGTMATSVLLPGFEIDVTRALQPK